MKNTLKVFVIVMLLAEAHWHWCNIVHIQSVQLYYEATQTEIRAKTFLLSAMNYVNIFTYFK